MEILPPQAPPHHQTGVSPVISKPSENKSTKRCLETNNATNTGGGGLVDTVLDTVAGFIAGATLPSSQVFYFLPSNWHLFFSPSNYFIVDNQGGNGKSLDKPGEEEKEEMEEKSKRTTPS